MFFITDAFKNLNVFGRSLINIFIWFKYLNKVRQYFINNNIFFKVCLFLHNYLSIWKQLLRCSSSTCWVEPRFHFWILANLSFVDGIYYFPLFTILYTIQAHCASAASQSYFPANIELFKVNNRNTRKICGIRSKLTIKIPERPQR